MRAAGVAAGAQRDPDSVKIVQNMEKLLEFDPKN